MIKARLLRAFAVLLGCACVMTVYAQSYPTRPVRLIVQYPPGGVHDALARILQPRLAEGLGQQIVVENRPGAGGNIAAELVAKSAADGHTLLVASDTVAVTPHLYKNPGFDLFKDFVPITKLATFPLALAVPPDSPAATIAEFVARAKAMPGQVTFASQGGGTLGQLVAEQFKALAGIDLVHVPYKGAGPAMTDLLAGRVQSMFAGLSVALPQARGGKLKIIGVATAARQSIAPNVPTFVESGYPGFIAGIYSGLMAPAGTPGEIVQRLNQEAARALRAPDVQTRLAELAAEATPTTPSGYAAALREEYERWGAIIRERGIKAD